MSRAEQATNRPTVVRDGAVAHVLLWTCFPLLGAAAGWVLSMVPGWLAALPEWVHALPMVPGREQVDLLAGLDGPVLTAVLSAVGLGAGALLALLSYGDMVVVEVGDGGVRITRGGKGPEIGRDRVGTVFLDGKDLVVLGPDTAEAARERTDHGAGRLRAAFEAHGYRWRDGDPHADEFQRWVDGMPGLEQHAQAVLRARRTALESGDADDCAELRGELARLGVVVREEGKRQYWRPVRRGAVGEG
ncbi:MULTISPECIES: YqeB family protein [Nocardiopsidaceae]|uniref:DUF308 domain-containing protein n=1 Tax=Streptomonospora nanhaiensis TaxID=1323731 RepID=A0ABY6YGQ7_9ACTN|nr:hypothetical protein [Streptomonospora nanhaiensis]WAE71440.1 hypothetical protein OUQ99_19625 [Streptomonospora nanhaiensis]